MNLSRFRMITFLALSLLVLVAVVAFGSWYAPLLGDAGMRLHQPWLKKVSKKAHPLAKPASA
jgi:hypothetical protein